MIIYYFCAYTDFKMLTRIFCKFGTDAILRQMCYNTDNKITNNIKTDHIKFTYLNIFM